MQSHLLFLFLDGVGLGANDPAVNPLARAKMPVLQDLLEGKRLLAEGAPFENQRASLLALDACLGVDGLPQSATGQAVLLTGVNIPATLGYHYGPKPNPDVAGFLRENNLFCMLHTTGHKAAFLNAYPQRYFDGIQSGKRLYAAIPLAATSAGISLRTAKDLQVGQAISADITAQGWRDHLNLPDTPVLTPYQAGQRLAELAQLNHFSLFEYWLSDYAGHRQDMQAACNLLETFDQTLEGLLASWDNQKGLILLTSDHGNMEDLSTRRHTTNPVPLLLIGEKETRRKFTQGLDDLTGITPAILRYLNGKGTQN
jgi:hypothetical protein